MAKLPPHVQRWLGKGFFPERTGPRCARCNVTLSVGRLYRHKEYCLKCWKEVAHG